MPPFLHYDKEVVSHFKNGVNWYLKCIFLFEDLDANFHLLTIAYAALESCNVHSDWIENHASIDEPRRENRFDANRCYLTVSDLSTRTEVANTRRQPSSYPWYLLTQQVKVNVMLPFVLVTICATLDDGILNDTALKRAAKCWRKDNNMVTFRNEMPSHRATESSCGDKQQESAQPERTTKRHQRPINQRDSLNDSAGKQPSAGFGDGHATNLKPCSHSLGSEKSGEPAGVARTRRKRYTMMTGTINRRLISSRGRSVDPPFWKAVEW